ncbi:hypothetical protein QTO34_006322 [Cnephaeus nilssonii]|uniref:Unc-50 inner nuclear membrane RNA binding protein n=1 Tax=Cnephaeus nilssonii TaxID=3371016 RepID=A0AA40LGL3_CNENI|nr:hypothetical protein QTO34_006322 [Eptesicus nilssonii]
MDRASAFGLNGPRSSLCRYRPVSGIVQPLRRHWLGAGGRKMLPSTSVSSPLQGNGALNSRDAARHTAGAKRYKYLRRLFRFRQMDFEFAAWQMLYLFTSPQRVYRNFHYRKQTKDQWARDDPAFLVLLSIWLCVSTVGFGFVLDMGFFKMIKLLLWVVFIDCVGVGLLISTLMCFGRFSILLRRVAGSYGWDWPAGLDKVALAFFAVLDIVFFISDYSVFYVYLCWAPIKYLSGRIEWVFCISFYQFSLFLAFSILIMIYGIVALAELFGENWLVWGCGSSLLSGFQWLLFSFFLFATYAN